MNSESILKRLNRLTNDRSIPHRARMIITETISHINEQDKRLNGEVEITEFDLDEVEEITITKLPVGQA